MIRSLHENGHQVTVLTFSSNNKQQDDAAHLTNFCNQVISVPMPLWRSLWNCLAALPSRKPLQSVFSWNLNGASALENLLQNGNSEEDFDVIHVEHLRGVRYALHAQRLQKLPVVWDSVDCISFLFRQATKESKSLPVRLISRLELARTEQFESKLSRQFSRILVTSKKDRAALMKLQTRFQTKNNNQKPIKDDHIQVVSNGVDLNYFNQGPFEWRDTKTVTVTGKMSYHANVSMVMNLATEIMPRVWENRPDVKLTIVGKDPGREIVALANNPQITVTGTVPDIRPYLHQATIAVAPLKYGAGVQNKILESMACGTPTITTSLAASPLMGNWKDNLLTADDPETFAKLILQLLDEPAQRIRLADAGRAYVESHYDWRIIAQQLADIYRAAVTNQG